jgi:hypothetical protein
MSGGVQAAPPPDESLAHILSPGALGRSWPTASSTTEARLGRYGARPSRRNCSVYAEFSVSRLAGTIPM